MPHDVVRASAHDRKRSLGHLANAWIEHFCIQGVGDVHGQPVRHTDEQYDFVVDCYALDDPGRMLYDSAFYSRPKGADKSGIGGRFALFEGLGPARFDGFAEGGEIYRDPWGVGFEYEYLPGEPMGRPVNDPFIRIMATEEGQTGNVYDTIYINLTEDGAPLAEVVPFKDVGVTWTNLPNGGTIIPSTASSASKDGGKETFVVFDETHLYNLPELRQMYRTVTRNLRKRKRSAGTWYLETTTMFAAGEDSVAEETYKLAALIREGSARRERLLFDHRYGICEDLSDEDALRAAIEDAFGDAIAWNDLDGIVDGFYDPRNPPEESRRYFLNAPSSAFDAWILDREWSPRAAPLKIVRDRETITLGFDGSRKRNNDVTDATALIACRVSDGHVFEPLTKSVWEQPTGAAGKDWRVPAGEVDRAVDEIFRRYRVVGFYADPAKWESYVAQWEARHGAKLKVKATRSNPIEWWITGGRARQMVAALESFLNAVVTEEMTHDGSFTLTRHILNARRRESRSGIQIAKENPDSPNKIDAAVAAVLAWQARVDAVAAGLANESNLYQTPARIR